MKCAFSRPSSKTPILIIINRHNNIIAYKEAFFDESSGTLCIVMEYADDGDLYNKIMHHKKL